MTKREQCLLSLGESIKKLGWVVTGVCSGHLDDAVEDIEAVASGVEEVTILLHELAAERDSRSS